MVNREVTITFTCDICGKQVEGFATPSEYTPRTYQVIEDVYMVSNDATLDVCVDCSNRIKELIDIIKEENEST